MLTPHQKDELGSLEKDLEERNQYLKWVPRVNKISQFIVICGALFLIIGYFFLETTLLVFVTTIIFSFFIMLDMFVGDFLLKQVEKKSPSSHKLTKYYTLTTLYNIDCFLNPKRAETTREKEKFRKNIIENSSALLTIIEKNWYIGDFLLGKKVLGETLSKFKNNLSNRLISKIQKSSEDSFLRTAESIFYNFSIFLDHPTREQLEHITEMIEVLDETKIQKKWHLLASFSTFSLYKKCVVILGLLTLIVPVSIYFVAINYFESTLSDAFSLSVAGAIGLGVLLLSQLLSILKPRNEKK